MVVADEAQHVKNPYSSTARRLRSLGARARVALTGTPVENNLSELWAILDWTTPGLLGRLGTFRRRYADAVEGGQDPAAADRLAVWYGRSSCAAASRTPGSRPSCRPRRRPITRCRSPRSRRRCTRPWCARRWPRSRAPAAWRGAG
ncbi:hypothetical protein GCM10023238_23160 [Streptomyces heliomycini]